MAIFWSVASTEATEARVNLTPARKKVVGSRSTTNGG